MDAGHRKNIEVISCSGHGKNGSLCVLQRSIRPDLVTAFELPGCRAVWTVYSGIQIRICVSGVNDFWEMLKMKKNLSTVMDMVDAQMTTKIKIVKVPFVICHSHTNRAAENGSRPDSPMSGT